MTRPYKFRPDGPGSTKPPMMIQINGVMCEARNIAVAYALDGYHTSMIRRRLGGKISTRQISQWLLEARKLGLEVPRFTRSTETPLSRARRLGRHVDRLAERAQRIEDRQLRKALEA